VGVRPVAPRDHARRVAQRAGGGAAPRRARLRRPLGLPRPLRRRAGGAVRAVRRPARRALPRGRRVPERHREPGDPRGAPPGAPAHLRGVRPLRGAGAARAGGCVHDHPARAARHALQLRREHRRPGLHRADRGAALAADAAAGGAGPVGRAPSSRARGPRRTRRTARSRRGGTAATTSCTRATRTTGPRTAPSSRTWICRAAAPCRSRSR
jgi:hypothetical protein